MAERIDALDPGVSLAMSFITWAELLQICRHYAQQATALRRRGTPIGVNHLWIACHALAIDATLVSHNVSEFARPPD